MIVEDGFLGAFEVDRCGLRDGKVEEELWSVLI